MAVLLAALPGACGGGDDTQDEESSATTIAASAPATAAAGAGLAGVFAPIAGYGYVELPQGVLGAMREQFATDPEFGEVVDESDARSVTRGGEGVGMVMALRLNERYAALPGIEAGILSEFTETSVSTRTLATAGDEVTIATDDEGTTFLVWVDGTLVLMVIGPSESALIPVATSLITSNR